MSPEPDEPLDDATDAIDDPAGEARTGHVTDDDVRTVLEHYDNPEHPDALSLSDVRARLATIQAGLEDDWPGVLTAIREGHLVVTSDDGRVAVLRDTERRWWDERLDALEVYDGVERTVLRVTHYRTATRLIPEADFDGSDPIVVRKPADAEAGQRFAEAVVTSLRRRGLPPEEAWAYYGVEVRGYDGAEWADRKGHDDRLHVAEAVEAARERLGE